MLGVDRLDMIKGIPQKILAFEKFLEENAYWRDKVVLLQIAVPTRTDVPECMVLNMFFSYSVFYITLETLHPHTFPCGKKIISSGGRLSLLKLICF